MSKPEDLEQKLLPFEAVAQGRLIVVDFDIKQSIAESLEREDQLIMIGAHIDLAMIYLEKRFVFCNRLRDTARQLWLCWVWLEEEGK